MYLIDTNVISEARKGDKANPGVRAFFREVQTGAIPVYLSAVTVGELRRGVELIRHRGDGAQAQRLEDWLQSVLDDYPRQILPLDADVAQVWGRLRVPHPEHELDKQIAATALVHGLTVVTRNDADFAGTSVTVRNPFTPTRGPPPPGPSGLNPLGGRVGQSPALGASSHAFDNHRSASRTHSVAPSGMSSSLKS